MTQLQCFFLHESFEASGVEHVLGMFKAVNYSCSLAPFSLLTNSTLESERWSSGNKNGIIILLRTLCLLLYMDTKCNANNHRQYGKPLFLLSLPLTSISISHPSPLFYKDSLELLCLWRGLLLQNISTQESMIKPSLIQ